MYSEMVKEVASFPELFPTMSVLTFHHSPYTFCNGMFEPQNFKMTCVGDVLAFANSMECLSIPLAVFFDNNFTLVELLNIETLLFFKIEIINLLLSSILECL